MVHLKKTTEIAEQRIIDNLAPDTIRANDGINIPTSPKPKIEIPNETSAIKNSIKTSIQTYINGLTNVSGWTIGISNWTANVSNGSFSYKITILKDNFSKKEIIVNYPIGTFKTTSELTEQNIIGGINQNQIISNDGITPPTAEKIPPPPSAPADLTTTITSYINSLSGVSNWIIRISNWTANNIHGFISYKVNLSKSSFTSRDFTVTYPRGSYKTNAEIKEQNKINSITSETIRSNDGITPPTSPKIIPPVTKPLNLESTIRNYINGLTNVSGWTIGILNWIPNPTNGSISYKVNLSKSGFTRKEIIVTYPKGSYQTIKEQEQLKINNLKPYQIELIDGIIANIADPKNSTKFKVPDQHPNLVKNIKDYFRNVLKLPDWNISVSKYTKNKAEGTLSYSVTISKSSFERVKTIKYPKWTFARNKILDNENQTYITLEGDISTTAKDKITKLDLRGYDVSQVTKWPTNLEGINWKGVIGLTPTNTPFKGDISSLKIQGFGSQRTSLEGIDVSQVTIWPKNLTGINWTGVTGLTTNTPFKGDISTYKIHSVWSGSPKEGLTILKGINVSKVTKWPKNLSFIDWREVTGITSTNTPFKGDLSLETEITNEKGQKVKVSNQIQFSILKGIDVSQVTMWPNDLRGVDWREVTGINSTNTPFKGDLSAKNVVMEENFKFIIQF